MFTPRYTITHVLLENIKRIHVLVSELNHRSFDHVVLVEFERAAREVSTYASTSIEGNPLPLTDVKRVLQSNPANARTSEREVLNYNQALVRLNGRLARSSTQFTTQLVLDIHRDVMAGLLPAFELGALRQRAVVVNDPRTGNVVYLPPDVSRVDPLVKELVDYVRRNKNVIDPLILAGIFHKQLVIIHPFMDGNGRTTRLATMVLLADMGLNTFSLFSFENYYNQNVSKYFATVGEYGDYNELVDRIDFTLWLEYFTGGIIDELLRVSKLLPESGVSPESRLEQHHRTILSYIEQHGSITDREYAMRTKRAKATRTIDFNKLILLGLIERKGKGKATYYVRRSVV